MTNTERISTPLIEFLVVRHSAGIHSIGECRSQVVVVEVGSADANSATGCFSGTSG